VAWNPTSPEVATAKDADLIVWDGSSTPTFVRLTPAQLLVGRTFFTTVSNRVEVRLDVIGAAGRARTESMVLVNRAPDLDPSPTLAIGPTKQAQALEDANASPPAAPLAPPALVKPAAPAAPAPKADNRLAELSKRPEAQSANGGPMAVLTQRFHEFNNSSAGVPRKAPDKTGPGREAERQQPAAETQPVKPAPLVTEEVSLGAFQAAVPIRERRPEIRSDLRTLIQSDNVVEVQVRINASGKVTAAKLGAMNGPLADVLAKPAVKAAMGWRFRPATENGEAVPSDKILEFLFRPSTR
jgi:Gram-negative bacterial TonB protein C-terminal